MEGEEKKNHQQNSSFVRTVFSQNAARRFLKKTIPHTLHFINKSVSPPDCRPNRALKTCSGNTDTPWKTQENLNGQQENNPNTFPLHLLTKTSNYSYVNLFVINKLKGHPNPEHQHNVLSFPPPCFIPDYGQLLADGHPHQAPGLLPRQSAASAHRVLPGALGSSHLRHGPPWLGSAPEENFCRKEKQRQRQAFCHPGKAKDVLFRQQLPAAASPSKLPCPYRSGKKCPA